MGGYDVEQLSARQRKVLARILNEKPDEPAKPIDGYERRDRLGLEAGGSWVVSTRSGSHYLLQLDGEEKTLVRLAVDHGHSYPDGTHALRRDGQVLPLLGLVDGPIEVGRPAYLVIGGLTDAEGYVSTTRATSDVTEIKSATYSPPPVHEGK